MSERLGNEVVVELEFPNKKLTVHAYEIISAMTNYLSAMMTWHLRFCRALQ
jgi:hypothetical protein